MAVDRYERILDPTARVPGRTYVCSFHCGFNEVHDPNNGGHYPALPDDVKCSYCVEWKDLCNKWITTGHPDDKIASVRCLRPKNHEGGHLVDDLDGQRFSWSEDTSVTVHDARSFEQAGGNLYIGDPNSSAWVHIGTTGTSTVGAFTLNPGDSVEMTWKIGLT